MDILFIRHAQTVWNAELRTQGRTDIPLSDSGKKQATLLAERLRASTLTHIYSSPLQRAMETAASIASIHAQTVTPSPLLLERNFGDWEGYPFAELREKYPDGMRAWETDPLSYTPPGAEPLSSVRERSHAFLQEIHRSHANNDVILVVGHSVPLRIMIADQIKLPLSSLHCLRLDNAGYTRLHIGKTYNTLMVLNDLSHLEDMH